MILECAGIRWAAAHNMLFFPLMVGVGGLLYYRLYKANTAVSLLAANMYAKQFVINFSSVRQNGKVLLQSLGLLFLFLALLGPQWKEKEQIVTQQGRDLFIALDVSRSMLAQDMQPNRLECAKKKIKHLLHHLSCERIGLILFSGSTFVQCPLTRDYSAFYMFLDQIDVETISSGTTAIDQAIQRALTTFEESGERKNKLLLLLTDGEDFSQNLTGIKHRAQQAGMNIFALGMASREGAPIPLFDSSGKPAGHQKDPNGTVVISRLNDTLLNSITQETGGLYLDASADQSDITTLVEQVQAFEKEAIEDKKLSRLEEQYPFFIAVSFLCFALEWLL